MQDLAIGADLGEVVGHRLHDGLNVFALFGGVERFFLRDNRLFGSGFLLLHRLEARLRDAAGNHAGLVALLLRTRLLFALSEGAPEENGGEEQNGDETMQFHKFARFKIGSSWPTLLV